MSFRDAGRGPSDFNLSIQDCLWGMWKAMQNGLCDMNEFSVEEYEFYEKVENGDWNWITPNFIAFASPVDSAWIKNQKEAKQAAADPPSPTRPGTASPTRSPVTNLALQRKLSTPFCNCLDYFEKRGVKLVVRLNTELYDRQLFLDRGITHQELYFDDGTNPTDEIVRTFIDLSDAIVETGGVIAVHVRHFLLDPLSAWRVRGNNSPSVQSGFGSNRHSDRGVSDLEIRVHCLGSDRFHAYRAARQCRGPTTAIHVPQTTGMGKVGSDR